MDRETAVHFVGADVARALTLDDALYAQAVGRAWERGDSHKLGILRALRGAGRALR